MASSLSDGARRVAHLETELGRLKREQASASVSHAEVARKLGVEAVSASAAREQGIIISLRPLTGSIII